MHPLCWLERKRFKRMFAGLQQSMSASAQSYLSAILLLVPAQLHLVYRVLSQMVRYPLQLLSERVGRIGLEWPCGALHMVLWDITVYRHAVIDRCHCKAFKIFEQQSANWKSMQTNALYVLTISTFYVVSGVVGPQHCGQSQPTPCWFPSVNKCTWARINIQS